MSKESRQHGLVTEGRPKYDTASKREDADTRRGRFVPDSPDYGRLLEHLHGAARRMT